MRTVLLLLLFVGGTLVVHGQQPSVVGPDSIMRFFRSKAIVEWLHENESKKRETVSIIRSPRITEGSRNNSEKFFSQRRNSVVYHWQEKLIPGKRDYVRIKADSLVFTEEEKKEIGHTLEELPDSNFKWTNGYFPGAIFPVASIDSPFRSNSGWWPAKGIYWISYPTFLRNNTFCVFSYAWLINGLSGNGGFKVYRQVRGTWLYYGDFSGGNW